MSDPLDRLRDPVFGSDPPSPDAIKRRASRIQARRRAVIGGSAAIALAAVGLVVALAGEAPNTSATLAEGGRTPTAEPRASSAQGQIEQEGIRRGGDELSQDADAAASQPEAALADRSAATSRGAAGGGEGAGTGGVTELELVLKTTTSSAGDDHRFEFRVCNRTDRVVDVTFPTSQRYDFEVSRKGEVVWRWSSDRGFAQAVGTETWEPGDCREWVEAWRGERARGGAAEPGAYSVVGVLTSDTERRSDPVEICRVTCL